MQPPRDDDKTVASPSGPIGPPPGSTNGNAKPGLKLAIDLFPLLVFFTAFRFLGIVPATAVLICATLLAVVVSKLVLGKIDTMLIVTAVLVSVFGGLTFAFDDPRFIKMKPTAVNLLFAAALGFGLLRDKNYLKVMLGEAFQLTEQGWRILTMRWMLFFVCLAVLNEVVWRSLIRPRLSMSGSISKFSAFLD